MRRLVAFVLSGALVLVACSNSGDPAEVQGSGGGGVGGLGSGGISGGGAAGSDQAGSGGDATAVTLCNGHEQLCLRRYDEVAFAATHNAHAAAESGFPPANANHRSPIAEQLEDGVRALLLDVYEEGGETRLCHGPCALGSVPHRDTLLSIRKFLEENDHDVVSLLYEDYVGAAVIESDFVATDLVSYVYAHDGGQWPTLQEMHDMGQRLVVAAQSAGPPPAWLHNLWDIAFDTPYSFNSPAEFTCDLNRGESTHQLFLLNHWVGTALGLPDPASAADVNGEAILGMRAAECRTQTGHIPNFVAVDFYEQGDLFKVVDTLNGL